MKTITYLFYKLFTKDFDEKLKSAKNIQSMLKASTAGRTNHFYNINGEKIRGYSNKVIQSKLMENPLIVKYK